MNSRSIQLVNIGFGNTVAASRVVAIVSPESSPLKRLVSEARESGKLIDATYGRKTRAIIVCDNFCVILSSLQPDTIANRIGGKQIENPDDDADELDNISV